MGSSTSSICTSLRGLDRIVWGRKRRGEPISVGIPLPAGAVRSATDIRIEQSNGRAAPAQNRPLDHWPDGSVRWALLHFLVDTDDGRVCDYVVRVDAGAPLAYESGLRISSSPKGVQVATGRALFAFLVGGAFPFSEVCVDGTRPIDVAKSGFRIDGSGPILEYTVSEVCLRDSGPLRAEIELRGVPRDGGLPLEVFARIEVFAGTATARVELTVRNRRRAMHPSGQWVLGDKGSVFLRSAALVLRSVTPVQRVECAPEIGEALQPVDLPFEIYQESSGGERWNSPVHRTADGQLPLRFPGYRLRSGEVKRAGDRACPIIVVHTADSQIAVTTPQFWENFPRALSVEGATIEIGLFPHQFPTGHELQGGEQKTHVVVLAFAEDWVSDPPLAWCHDPALVYPPSEWCCGTGVVPFIVCAAADPHRDYLGLVGAALDADHGFVRKREDADEYGWRNYGDLVADHESAFRPAAEPFVSHYNNQYDASAGFAIHFLRTGDPRWWRLMADLARHVRDIDIYHTDEDKVAYSGGMFWHTLHYADAGTSTHRSYPRGRKEGGGPSAEHNYNFGLMLHYFITGDLASRDAAVDLGRWVIRMDDGRRTMFRWLAGGPTGLASATGAATYHGPGRGAANSILACLVAYQLTGDQLFISKTEELIRRCITPQDDLEALNLRDVERRWYYTVFLQSLGTYLAHKQERLEFDDMFGYAQASLLHYARWMSEHERPYLDRPEILEFPTETWAAQDMRKSEVFLWAALHSEGAERAAFVERARLYFRYSVGTLTKMPGHRFTRPIVLMLSNGVRQAWFDSHVQELPPPARPSVESLGFCSNHFEPQKTRALRRVRWLVVAALAGGLSLAALLVL
jgi:hypothetical protein